MRQEVLNLKRILLEKKLVKDNSYLNRYLGVVNDVLERGNIKQSGFQGHHVIPVVVYSTLNKVTRDDGVKLANIDSNNFIINVSKQDHLYLHCLLAKCGTDWFKEANLRCLGYFLGIDNFTSLQATQLAKDFRKSKRSVYKRPKWKYLARKGLEVKYVVTEDIDAYKLAGWTIIREK